MPKSPDAFRTISEVADWLGIQAHVLRFWESKFTQVKPIKRAGGRRYYRPADMLLLGGIKKLLHDDGLTIKGVQKILREDGMSHVAAMSPPLDDADIEFEETVGVQDPEPMLMQAPAVSSVVLPFQPPKDPAKDPAPTDLPLSPDDLREEAAPATASEDETSTPGARAPDDTPETVPTNSMVEQPDAGHDAPTVAAPLSVSAQDTSNKIPAATDQTADAPEEVQEPEPAMQAPPAQTQATAPAVQDAEPATNPQVTKSQAPGSDTSVGETHNEAPVAQSTGELPAEKTSDAAPPLFAREPETIVQPAAPPDTDTQQNQPQAPAHPTPAHPTQAQTAQATAPAQHEEQAAPAQPEEQAAPVAPKPRDIGMPTLTPEKDIPARTSTLAHAGCLRSVDAATAQKMTPLLAQLAVLRDRMAAPRSTAPTKF